MIDLILAVLLDFSLAFFVACCWGILFGTPFKALWMVGLLGGFGHALRFVLLDFEVGLIASTFVASIVVGLSGIAGAHKVHTPPVVLTMPACITMIPGLYAYRTMLALIKLSDKSILDHQTDIIPNIAHNAVLTFSLLIALAVGISVSAIFFRNKSAKDIRWSKLI